MPDELTELDKIHHAAQQAADVVAQAAAEAKNVINQAAASAISTLTTAAAVQSRDIEYIKDGMNKINGKLDKIYDQFVPMVVFIPVAKKVEEIDGEMVKSRDFEFWRNLLVSGILLNILLGVIAILWKIHV